MKNGGIFRRITVQKGEKATTAMTYNASCRKRLLNCSLLQMWRKMILRIKTFATRNGKLVVRSELSASVDPKRPLVQGAGLKRRTIEPFRSDEPCETSCVDREGIIKRSGESFSPSCKCVLLSRSKCGFAIQQYA
jgi:hypothetical protein